MQDIEQRAPNTMLILALAAVSLLYALAFSPRVGKADPSVYVTLAKSLAMGRGFRDINLPGALPHTHYPPGLPLLLAPVFWVFPEFPANAPMLVAWLGLWGVLLVPATYWLLCNTRLLLSHRFSLAVALLTAINPVVVFLSVQTVMSESVYLVLSLLCLGALTLSETGGRTGRYAWGIGILALAAAYYVRTVGLALFLALVLYELYRQRWRRAILTGGGFLALIAPWMLRNARAGSGLLSSDYSNVLWVRDFWRPDLGIISLWELPGRILGNIWAQATENVSPLIFPTLRGDRLVGFLRAHGFVWVVGLAGLVLTALMVAGYVRRFRAGPGRLEFYLPLYLGIILLPPWHETRNLIPIYPFLLVYLILGIRWTLKQVPGNVTRLAPALLLGLMLVSALVSDRHLLADGANYRAGRASGSCSGALFAWAREQTPPGSLFMEDATALFYLCTGRKAVNIPRETDPERFLARLQKLGVQYVPYDSEECGETRYSAACSTYVRPFVERYQPQLLVDWQAPGPSSMVVYRVDSLPRRSKP